MSWIQGIRTRLHLLVDRRAVESRMVKEFRFHIEMETARIMRDDRVNYAEARRRAMGAFGGVENYKEEIRDGRGLRWIAGLSLDLKLGFRMLLKYPGLTLVGCFALAVAISAGASYLELLHDAYRSTLPVADADRVVMIQNWDMSRRQRAPHVAHDYVTWRAQLKSIQDFGVFQTFQRNLITNDGLGEPVDGAETTASAFRIMGGRALVGRTLLDSDELPSSTPVVVLGFSLWQTRFGGDSSVVGQTVQVDGKSRVVVGVMPSGFTFPDSKQLWIPLQLNASDYARGAGPAMHVLGRLVPGVQVASAQAELTTIGARAAIDFPATNRNLRPIVKPYLEWISLSNNGGEDTMMMQLAYFVNLFFIGLLCLCGSNVATLVFARTAARSAELSVRTALGASRGRLVAQLFAEALVLCTLATVVGLLAAYYGMRSSLSGLFRVAGGELPFWWNEALSAETFAYAVLLALFAAVIVGVVPALKATGPELHSNLKHATSGGAGTKFGRLWTGVIVTQVAVTVLFLFIVVSIGWNVRVGRYVPMQVELPTQEFLTARLVTDEEKLPDGTIKPLTPEVRARFSATYEQLKLKLLAEPGVKSVTFASQPPGVELKRFYGEVDTTGGARVLQSLPDVRTAAVDAEFFEAVNARIVAGRAFNATDASLGHRVTIVDQSFAKFVFGGANAIGQRVRRRQAEGRDKPGEWYEIIGVVADLTTAPDKLVTDAVLYIPSTAGDAYPITVAVHVAGNAASLTHRFRAVSGEADPTLRLFDVVPLSQIGRSSQWVLAYVVRALAVLGFVGVMLSSAGVYALMAFTVARRTREIGIRVALGANSRRVVSGTLLPALRPVGMGVVLGSIPGIALVAFGAPEIARGGGAIVALVAFAAVGAFTLCVGLAAGFVPTRRALGIQPTVALNAAG